MSLTLLGNICKPCGGSVLKVTDVSGLYNNNTNSPYYNLTGWNGSNVGISTATSALLNVTRPDPSTNLPSGDAIAFDLYNTLPNVVDQAFSISEEDAGFGWVDGIYYFEYVVVANGTTYTYTQYQLISCEVDCCIEKLAEKCKCDKKAQKLFSDAYDKWMEMKYAARCGNINQAAEILTDLQNICNGADCGCGCS